jgi:hypothetical protein
MKIAQLFLKARAELGLPYVASTMSTANGFTPTVISLSTFGFDYARPIHPFIHVVGPLEDKSKLDPLPAELETWMNSHQKIVYAAFGSIAPITEEVVSTLVSLIISS